HNVDLATCCDWLEGSALISDEGVAGPDIVDSLCESSIYANQDFAWELLGDTFSHLKIRARILGEGYPFHFSDPIRLERRRDWEDFPAYSFCLTASLSHAYPKWAKTFGADFTQQADLFEKLTAESIRASLVGWSVHETGWGRKKTRELRSTV